MIKNNFKQNCFYAIILAALTLGSLVILNGFGLRFAFRTYIVIPFIVFFFFWLIRKKNEPAIENSLDIVYLIFCGFVLVSGIGNLDVYTIISALIGVLIFSLLKSLSFEDLDRIYLPYAIAYAGSCLIIFCRYPISPINSEGVMFSLLGITWLNVICKKRYENYFVFFLISSIVIFLIMATRARTPLAAFIVVDIVSYFYLFAKQKNYLKKILRLFLFIVVIYLFSDYIIESLDQYFFHKWGNSDMSSGRENYWKIIMSNLSLFGYGIGKGNFIKILEINAHNSWIQVFGNFGPICGVLFVVLTVIILSKIYSVRNKIIYFNFFLGWIIWSLFEDVSFFSSRYIPVTIAFYIHFFLLSKECNRQIYLMVVKKEG